MKHVEEKTYKSKYVSKITCDKCGEDVEKDLESSYDNFNCIIRESKGSTYPEGDFREVRQIDLCPSCADELFSDLKQKGFNINEFDADEEVRHRG